MLALALVRWHLTCSKQHDDRLSCNSSAGITCHARRQFQAHAWCAARQVGAIMLNGTWKLVVAVRTDSVRDHPLFSSDDAKGARQPLLPKKSDKIASEV